MRDLLKNPTPVAGDVVNDKSSIFDGFEIISAISRAQCIRDGILIDLSRYANLAGIIAPIAITATGFARALRDPRHGGDPTPIEILRLLNWVRAAIGMHKGESGEFTETFPRIDMTPIPLKVHAGPGDYRELVLTIMLPDED